jgi:Flp pilus assembly protein TadG
MMLHRQRRRRKGTVLLEAAFVYPVLFVLVLAIILLGVGVFRYQQVAHAAREGARYAAVHGTKYASDTGHSAATATDVYNNAIKPHLSGAHTENITYDVKWYDGWGNETTSKAQTLTKSVTTGGVTTVQEKANTVSVKVTYTWNTGFFGTIPVSSTSVMVMAY